MGFGFQPVSDQVRAGSSYLDMSRYLELLERGRRPVRSWYKSNSITVTDRSEAGCRPVADLLSGASSLLAS